MNFDSLLTRMSISEMEGRIQDTIWDLERAINNYPNAARKSLQIEDFVKHLSWVVDPQILMGILNKHRVETNDQSKKDFHNRKILSILGEYVDCDEFWLTVCLKYPDYSKYYKKASEEFKTAIRIVS